MTFLRSSGALLCVLFAASVGAPVRADDGTGVSPVAVSGDAARYWTRWRGPGGQGVAPGGGYPSQWDASRNVLWRAEVPGADISSPVVYEDKVFLTTAHEDPERRSILAYRRGDGARLWETFAPDAPDGGIERKALRSVGSPVTDGKRVYAYLGRFGVLAVDLEGKVVWHRKMGRYDHGTASPLLYDGMIYVPQIVIGRTQKSVLYALNAEDGSVVWKRERSERTPCGTPVAVRVGDTVQLVLSGQAQIRAYDPYDGRELWKARGNNDEAVPTPVVGYGMVFSASGPAGPVYAVHPSGEGNVTDSHIQWEKKQWGPMVPSPLFWEGYLYVVNDMSSVLTCFEAATGTIVWQERLGKARREGFVASPVVAEGRLFFTNVEGETFVVEPGSEFRLLGVNPLGATVRASPALADGTWYFRTDRHLIAIGAPD